MAIVRSVVTFPAESGNPEDNAQNVWHFTVAAGPVESGDYSAIGAALNAFYCSDPAATGATAPMTYMATAVIGTGAVTVDHYIVASGGDVGSPTGYSELINFVAGNSIPLPEEVALCVSFHGNLSGIPEDVPAGPAGPAGNLHLKARRRGRIFLPFLNIAALSDSAGHCRPDPAMVDGIVENADELMNSSELAGLGITWSVYSRQADAAYDVTGGWIDNSFDTQRRRGGGWTSRTVWS